MKINLAATKTNLLKTKRSLALTQEGYGLLDEKRKILLQELTSIVDSVDKHQAALEKALAQGYQLVDKALIGIGRQRMEEITFAVDIQSQLSISERRVMGVTVPLIELSVKDRPPYYSPYEVNLYADEAIAQFKRILELLAKLAEKKITLIRLAEEAQKTIRKVNALEKVYLPYYREAFKYIGDRLDEEARDGFAMLKLIKQKKLK